MSFGVANAAVTPDSETLVYNLTGEIASVCTLAPDGPVDVNVNMSDTGNQNYTIIAYSCNSPYHLTLKSANGGMKHTVDSSINVPYAIETNFGFGATYQSTAITSPVTIASESSWASIWANGGVKTGNIDLGVEPQANDRDVAGTYKDTLTLVLTADL